jgi:thiamine-phosphate pyrophosphorylase
MEAPRLTLVTDDAWDEERILEVVIAVARSHPGGLFAVQLRDRMRSGSERAAWALRLREAARDAGASFVLNGSVELARELGADGVHFGGRATDEEVASARGVWRSLAAHSEEDVVRAVRLGVDAVLVSPIFETPGKGPARGIAALERSAALARGRVAVIALGGVTPDRAAACALAGASGVAVIRALLDAEDVRLAARALMVGRAQDAEFG